MFVSLLLSVKLYGGNSHNKKYFLLTNTKLFILNTMEVKPTIEHIQDIQGYYFAQSKW
jgi:hypothetical protein